MYYISKEQTITQEDIMKFIYADYNMYRNSVDVYTFDRYLLRIDCNMDWEPLPAFNVR